MNSKTDKEDRSCDDIAFLSEIIVNSRYWQVICNRSPAKFEANLEHIINIAGFQIISIYRRFGNGLDFR